MSQLFSAPTVANVELTEACNQTCRHCYNFWRQDGGRVTMTRERFDALVEQFVDAGVFHVVLSGGEPFLAFELLEYGLRTLVERNISISCNSNLLLATEDKLKRLRDTGLDHILTSLNSHDAAVNDRMVNREGSLEKIVKGIELAVQSGIRISANMIISQPNKHHVYDTGRLAHELGVQRLFATRTVPPSFCKDPTTSDVHLEPEDARLALEQMLALKRDTGIMIGTLVSYPLCFLGDLEKFSDFVGRGCPGQSGHCININATGLAHACVHQAQDYGNVFEEGLKTVFARMRPWHDNSYMHAACEGCAYHGICRSGCRSSAHAYSGDYAGRDPLMTAKERIVTPFRLVRDNSLPERIQGGAVFQVPKRLRFRQEDGFTLLNIRWGNTVTCPDQVARVLQAHRDSGEPLLLQHLGPEIREGYMAGVPMATILAELFSKDALESRDIPVADKRAFLGLSANLNPVAAQS